MESGQCLVVVKHKNRTWQLFLFEGELRAFVREVELREELNRSNFKSVLTTTAAEHKLTPQQSDWSRNVFDLLDVEEPEDEKQVS